MPSSFYVQHVRITTPFSFLLLVVLRHCAGQHSIVHDCRLVLENSGVAEPHAIRDRFMQATEANRPLMQRLRLDTLVTVCPCALLWCAVHMQLSGGTAGNVGTAGH